MSGDSESRSSVEWCPVCWMQISGPHTDGICSCPPCPVCGVAREIACFGEHVGPLRRRYVHRVYLQRPVDGRSAGISGVQATIIGTFDEWEHAARAGENLVAEAKLLCRDEEVAAKITYVIITPKQVGASPRDVLDAMAVRPS
jgi:hypothetical protein